MLPEIQLPMFTWWQEETIVIQSCGDVARNLALNQLLKLSNVETSLTKPWEDARIIPAGVIPVIPGAETLLLQLEILLLFTLVCWVLSR